MTTTTPRQCECGCGTAVNRRFAQGHNSKRFGQPTASSMAGPNPSGLCMCGCGLKTTIATATSTAAQRFKGKPVRFILGHQMRLRLGESSSRWKGGRILTNEGYVKIRVPIVRGETRSKAYKYEHRVVLEQFLGRTLAVNEQVHHINGDKTDNRPENLELWHRSQPNGVRREDYHCPGCCCPP